MDNASKAGLQWLENQQQNMLQKTIALAEINSGSYHIQGINQVADLMSDYFQVLQGWLERFQPQPVSFWDKAGQQIQQPLGQGLLIEKRPQAPLQLYFGGHLDTVFPANSAFQQVHSPQPNILHGPGITDMKGGIMVMLHALMAFEQHPLAKNIGWRVLLNPDEEIGSHGSMPFIQKAAQQSDIGLIYEPCFENGNLASQRKGSGNFTVKVTGRAAHAGRAHHLGRNAIRAMADFTVLLDQLNQKTDDATINPGIIYGGDAVNIVPDWCILKFNVRVEHAQAQQWISDQLKAIEQEIAQKDGISIVIDGGFTRPAKVITPQNQQLLDLAIDCSQQLDMQIEYAATGGCCDGNNLASFGVPNIDTMGVHGGKIHSDQEFLIIDSLYKRAQLSFLLLVQLASNPQDWIRRKN